MKLVLTQEYFISEITSNDKKNLIKYLNQPEISDNTLAIPFPYTESDADFWINHVIEETKKIGKPINFAIRNSNCELIGGIGFNFIIPDHKAELGYWLTKEYWGRGIMTKAVIKICEYGFLKFNLVRVQATVFHFNERSETVLKKAGFAFEGVLKNYYLKNGKIFDGFMYSKIGFSSPYQWQDLFTLKSNCIK